MGRHVFMFLTTFLLYIKEYGVSSQYVTVLDCLQQGAATVSATPIIQSAGQYILPAIIQPIIPGYDSSLEPYGPNYGSYPAPSPSYPPIIIKDDDDLLRNLLYFLIFSKGNKKDSYNGYCSGSGKCPYCSECPYCKQNNAQNAQNSSGDTGTSSSSTANTDGSSSNAPVYIPVPIAIPVYTSPDGYRYIDGFCDDILVQEPYDSYYARDGEVSVIIRTDGSY